MQPKIKHEKCYRCGVIDSSVYKAGAAISESNPEFKNKNLCSDCRIDILFKIQQ